MKKEEVYNPSHPDGQNNNIKELISYDGIGKIGNRYLIPAKQGRAARLKKGQSILIYNPEGNQVCDFFCNYRWGRVRVSLNGTYSNCFGPYLC